MSRARKGPANGTPNAGDDTFPDIFIPIFAMTMGDQQDVHFGDECMREAVAEQLQPGPDRPRTSRRRLDDEALMVRDPNLGSAEDRSSLVRPNA